MQNCAALPENLFESILFGSVKGAFTGSIDRAGLFEEANGGTLFLDELNSMPINLQAKLLRVIQDGVVRRIGDNKEKKVDVRILAAMNMEPMKAIEKEMLREDLFFRLGVTTFRLLPLRERREDIPCYIKHFIGVFNKKYGNNVEGVTEDVMSLFKSYTWPGNVREIQHILESAMNFCEEKMVTMTDLPVYLEQSESQIGDLLTDGSLLNYSTGCSLDEMVETLEKDVIKKALISNKGNISRTARMLKITRQKLHYKISKYGLEE